LALIRHVAAVNNQPDLALADTDQLLTIYRHTGGNPLAVKLVVGMAATKPLSIVLADLPQAHLVKTEALYRHIYWRAWHALSVNAQRLLKAMPLVGTDSAQPTQMQHVTRLPDAAFWNAVTELTGHSLLVIKGTTFTPRYGIHRLTHTFLKTEIIQWPVESTLNS
jgi:hypothetical protein